MSGILNSPYPILICSVEYELSEKFKSEVCSKMYWTNIVRLFKTRQFLLKSLTSKFNLFLEKPMTFLVKIEAPCVEYSLGKRSLFLNTYLMYNTNNIYKFSFISQASAGKYQIQTDKAQSQLDKTQSEFDRMQEKFERSQNEIRKVSSLNIISINPYKFI